MEAKEIAQEQCETEKLFYQDSHMQEFDAVVLACEERKDGFGIVLDRTAFFPEGGGQFGDTGWLNEMPVIDTKEKKGIIYHVTGTAMEVGTKVHGKLDFAKRFDRMQQHTGEHILSGIVHSLYGYDNVGFHLGEELTTLDFNGELTKEQVQDVEIQANQAVFANLPVKILYPDKAALAELDYRSKIEIEGQVRIVEIPGVDLCACCAPHVDTTGEIGLIKILSCNRHRGGCRMVMVSGMRALMDYQHKQHSVTEVSVALSAKPENIADAVLRVKKQQMKLRENLNRIQATYLKEKLDAVSSKDTAVLIFEEELDTPAVRNFVNDAMGISDGICGAFVGNDQDGYHYIIGSNKKDVRVLARVLNEQFNGRGGGKPEMVQGSLMGDEAAIRAAITAAITENV